MTTNNPKITSGHIKPREDVVGLFTLYNEVTSAFIEGFTNAVGSGNALEMFSKVRDQAAASRFLRLGVMAQVDAREARITELENFILSKGYKVPEIEKVTP